MNNKTMYYLTGVVLLAIVVLFGFNFLTMFWNPYPQTYLAHNQVRGMATQYHGKLYTLNFDQQNEVTDLLNQSVVVKPDLNFSAGEKPAIEKLIIYRFNAPDIVITPISILSGHYLFSAPAWQKEGYLQDISPGELVRVLSNTYDRD